MGIAAHAAQHESGAVSVRGETFSPALTLAGFFFRFGRSDRLLFDAGTEAVEFNDFRFFWAFAMFTLRLVRLTRAARTRFAAGALVALAASFALACGPVQFSRPAPEPARVWELDCRALHNSYRDRSERWTGQTVRVLLPFGSYSVSGRELHWHDALSTDPPDVVFECESVPAGGAAIEVVALCVGRVEDTLRRTNGLKFHVRLTASGVTSR